MKLQKTLGTVIFFGFMINFFITLLLPSATLDSNSIEKFSKHWRVIFLKNKLEKLSEEFSRQANNENCYLSINAGGYPFIFSIAYDPGIFTPCFNDDFAEFESEMLSELAASINIIIYGILVSPLVYLFLNKKEIIKNKLEKLQIRADSEENKLRLKKYEKIATLLKMLIIILIVIIISIVIKQFFQ